MLRVYTLYAFTGEVAWFFKGPYCIQYISLNSGSAHGSLNAHVLRDARTVRSTDGGNRKWCLPLTTWFPRSLCPTPCTSYLPKPHTLSYSVIMLNFFSSSCRVIVGKDGQILKDPKPLPKFQVSRRQGKLLNLIKGFFFFWDKASLVLCSSPSCPGMHIVDQAHLKLIEIHLLLPPKCWD